MATAVWMGGEKMALNIVTFCPIWETHKIKIISQTMNFSLKQRRLQSEHKSTDFHDTAENASLRSCEMTL